METQTLLDFANAETHQQRRLLLAAQFLNTMLAKQTETPWEERRTHLVRASVDLADKLLNELGDPDDEDPDAG